MFPRVVSPSSGELFLRDVLAISSSCTCSRSCSRRVDLAKHGLGEEDAIFVRLATRFVDDTIPICLDAADAV